LFTRTVSILACEAVGLFTLGVVTNRTLDLYPSWAALLHARDLSGGKHGVTFAWEPPGWTGWGLAQPPEAVLVGHRSAPVRAQPGSAGRAAQLGAHRCR
jgi:hypothetical protein